METSVEDKLTDKLTEKRTLLQEIQETFQYEPVDIRTFSPLTLAYIGDAIFDLIIRTVIVEKGNRSPQTLHKETSEFVKAGTQSAMIEYLLPYLSEEETAVYHRGRNAKSGTTAKNASVGDYRKATGLEALFGFLYLQNNTARCLELVKQGLQGINLTL